METAAPLTAADTGSRPVQALREFVLHIDVTLEQLRTEMQTEFGRLRTEMQTEFGRVHTALGRLDTRLEDHHRRLGVMERQMLPRWASGYIALLLTIIAAAVVYGVLR